MSLITPPLGMGMRLSGSAALCARARLTPRIASPLYATYLARGLHSSLPARNVPPPNEPPSPSSKPHTHESASTALLPDIAQREGAAVVGGTDGRHYNIKNPEDKFAVQHSGQWTMMNPIYTESDLDSVQVVCREPVTIGDKAAHGVVKLLRRSFDFVSGYVAKPIPEGVLKQDPIPIAELRAKGDILSDREWLRRIILLESIAGVPGMVAGTLRHLRSLRLLRRDGGWIHTLLEEAENERMHLLTFMAVSQPTWFTRALVMGGQAVFYCAFFGTYLIAPKVAHRFVGALEEEAVRTYTHCIKDVQAGLVPEWNGKPAPQIAIDYWRLPEDATLLDVIRAVRADEATHRFVNHSLANLDQERDFNPFALAEAPAEVRGSIPEFTREQSAEFAREQQSHMLIPPHKQAELEQKVTEEAKDAKKV